MIVKGSLAEMEGAPRSGSTMVALLRSLIEGDRITFSYVLPQGDVRLNEALHGLVLRRSAEPEHFTSLHAKTVSMSLYWIFSFMVKFYQHKFGVFLVNADAERLEVARFFGLEGKIVRDLGEKLPDKSVVVFYFSDAPGAFSLDQVRAAFTNDVFFIFADEHKVKLSELDGSHHKKAKENHSSDKEHDLKASKEVKTQNVSPLFSEFVSNRYDTCVEFLNGKNKGAILIDWAHIFGFPGHNYCSLMLKVNSAEQQKNTTNFIAKLSRLTISSQNNTGTFIVQELLREQKWLEQLRKELSYLEGK